MRTVAQSTPPDTPIINVTATDGDEENTPNSEISFSLLDTSLPFEINASSGLLSTGPGLMAQNYSVVVIATDNGIPPLQSNGMIIVTVAPPNSHSPVFPSDFTASITENTNTTGNMSLTIYTFEVTDDDVGPEGEVELTLLPSQYSVNFTLVSGAQGTLSYNVNQLGFDREMIENFTLPIQAVDQGNVLFRRTSEALLFVTVEDVNDNPPVFVDTPYMAMASENASVGTSVFTVRAVDDDEETNAMIAYSLVNSSDFTIDPDSGVISVAGNLTVSVFNITVSAYDGAFSSNTLITIMVVEVNDNPPQFIPPLPTDVTLPENAEVGLVVLNITASDADTGISGEVVLRLSQEENVFGVESYPNSTSEFFISLNEPLDFEVSLAPLVC